MYEISNDNDGMLVTGELYGIQDKAIYLLGYSNS